MTWKGKERDMRHYLWTSMVREHDVLYYHQFSSDFGPATVQKPKPRRHHAFSQPRANPLNPITPLRQQQQQQKQGQRPRSRRRDRNRSDQPAKPGYTLGPLVAVGGDGGRVIRSQNGYPQPSPCDYCSTADLPFRSSLQPRASPALLYPQPAADCPKCSTGVVVFPNGSGPRPLSVDACDYCSRDTTDAVSVFPGGSARPIAGPLRPVYRSQLETALSASPPDSPPPLIPIYSLGRPWTSPPTDGICAFCSSIKAMAPKPDSLCRPRSMPSHPVQSRANFDSQKRGVFHFFSNVPSSHHEPTTVGHRNANSHRRPRQFDSGYSTGDIKMHTQTSDLPPYIVNFGNKDPVRVYHSLDSLYDPTWTDPYNHLRKADLVSKMVAARRAYAPDQPPVRNGFDDPVKRVVTDTPPAIFVDLDEPETARRNPDPAASNLSRMDGYPELQAIRSLHNQSTPPQHPGSSRETGVRSPRRDHYDPVRRVVTSTPPDIFRSEDKQSVRSPRRYPATAREPAAKYARRDHYDPVRRVVTTTPPAIFVDPDPGPVRRRGPALAASAFRGMEDLPEMQALRPLYDAPPRDDDPVYRVVTSTPPFLHYDSYEPRRRRAWAVPASLDDFSDLDDVSELRTLRSMYDRPASVRARQASPTSKPKPVARAASPEISESFLPEQATRSPRKTAVKSKSQQMDNFLPPASKTSSRERTGKADAPDLENFLPPPSKAETDKSAGKAQSPYLENFLPPPSNTDRLTEKTESPKSVLRPASRDGWFKPIGKADSPEQESFLPPPAKDVSRGPDKRSKTPPLDTFLPPPAEDFVQEKAVKSDSPDPVAYSAPVATPPPRRFDVLPPPERKFTPPPARHYTPPPVKESTQPPVRDTTSSPGKVSTPPPVRDYAPPPVAKETTAAPKKDDTSPPARDFTQPPVRGKSPVRDYTSSSRREKTPPPIKDDAPPPAGDYTQPPVRGKTPPPVRDYTPPSRREKIPPRVKEYTPPPVKDYTSPPVKEHTPPPIKEYAPTQVKEKTPPTAKEPVATPPPRRFDVLPPPPVRRHTPPPVKEYTPPPVIEYTPPRVREYSPIREYTPPPAREKTPPTIREYVQPPLRDMTPPPIREYTPPPMTEKKPPIVREMTPPLESSPPPAQVEILPPSPKPALQQESEPELEPEREPSPVPSSESEPGKPWAGIPKEQTVHEWANHEMRAQRNKHFPDYSLGYIYDRVRTPPPPPPPPPPPLKPTRLKLKRTVEYHVTQDNEMVEVSRRVELDDGVSSKPLRSSSNPAGPQTRDKASAPRSTAPTAAGGGQPATMPDNGDPGQIPPRLEDMFKVTNQFKLSVEHHTETEVPAYEIIGPGGPDSPAEYMVVDPFGDGTRYTSVRPGVITDPPPGAKRPSPDDDIVVVAAPERPVQYPPFNPPSYPGTRQADTNDTDSNDDDFMSEALPSESMGDDWTSRDFIMSPWESKSPITEPLYTLGPVLDKVFDHPNSRAPKPFAGRRHSTPVDRDPDRHVKRRAPSKIPKAKSRNLPTQQEQQLPVLAKPVRKPAAPVKRRSVEGPPPPINKPPRTRNQGVDPMPQKTPRRRGSVHRPDDHPKTKHSSTQVEYYDTDPVRRKNPGYPRDRDDRTPTTSPRTGKPKESPRRAAPVTSPESARPYKPPFRPVQRTPVQKRHLDPKYPPGYTTNLEEATPRHGDPPPRGNPEQRPRAAPRPRPRPEYTSYDIGGYPPLNMDSRGPSSPTTPPAKGRQAPSLPSGSTHRPPRQQNPKYDVTIVGYDKVVRIQGPFPVRGQEGRVV